MVSHSQRLERMLREAREAVAALRAQGATTRALELELRRGERAIEGERWDEARSRLERVLSSRRLALLDEDAEDGDEAGDGGSRALSIPGGPSQPAVREKLDQVRQRIEALRQFGVDTSGLEASAARADQLLGGSYLASADSIADELLVMSKAAAEGVRQLSDPGDRPQAGAPHGEDFVGLLRGAVTRLAGSSGWLGEAQVRALIDETLPKFYVLERHVAEQLHRQDGAALRALQDLRTDLSRDLAERSGALQAALQALREDGGPAQERSREELHALAVRAEATGAALAAIDGTLTRLAAAHEEHGRALEQVAADLEAQRQRLEASADAASVETLADDLEAVRAELAEAAPRAEVRALAARCASLDDAQRRHDEAQSALAAALREADERARGGLAELGARLVESSDEQGQVLVHLEAAVDQANQRLAALPDHSALAERVVRLTQDLERLLAGDARAQALAREQADLARRLGEVQRAVEAKADAEGMAGKADAAALAARIAGKADAAAVDALGRRLAGKADAAALDSLAQRLAGKADQATVADLDARLAGKADAAALDELAQRQAGKADQATLTALAARLADKADAAALEALATGLAGKADVAGLDDLAQRVGAVDRAALALGDRLVGKADAAAFTELSDAIRLKADAGRLAALEARLDNLRRAIDEVRSAQEDRSRAVQALSQREPDDGVEQRLAVQAQKLDERVEALAGSVHDLRSALAGKAEAAGLREVEASASRAIADLRRALAAHDEALAASGTRADVAQQVLAAHDTALAGLAASATRADIAQQVIAAHAAALTASGTRADVAQQILAAHDAALAAGNLRADAALQILAEHDAALAASAARVDAAQQALAALAARVDAMPQPGTPGAARSAGARDQQPAELPHDALAQVRHALAEGCARLDERCTALETSARELGGGNGWLADLQRRVLAMEARPGAAAQPVDGSLEARLAALEARLDASTRLADRISALEQRPVAAPPGLDEAQRHALEEAVLARLKSRLPDTERIQQEIDSHLHGGGLDLKAMRKALPELLASPEAGGIIINTVLIEALSGRGVLGEATGLRRLVREEIGRVGMESSGAQVRISDPLAKGPEPRVRAAEPQAKAAEPKIRAAEPQAKPTTEAQAKPAAAKPATEAQAKPAAAKPATEAQAKPAAAKPATEAQAKPAAAKPATEAQAKPAAAKPVSKIIPQIIEPFSRPGPG